MLPKVYLPSHRMKPCYHCTSKMHNSVTLEYCQNYISNLRTNFMPVGGNFMTVE